MTKPIKRDKKSAKFDADGHNMSFFKKRPINDAILDKLAEDYIKWGTEDENALVLVDFPISIGMYPKSFYLLRKRHKGLQEAHAIVKAAVGSRREKGAIKRKFDSGMIKPSMPMYSEDFDDRGGWKALGEWHAALKSKEEENNKQNITVVIDKMPETDKVPNK